MKTLILDLDPGSPDESLRQQLDVGELDGSTWFLVYCVQDAPITLVLSELSRRFPRTPAFGATSFRGVFTPRGFDRSVALLVGSRDDDVRVEVSLQKANSATAFSAAQQACRDLQRVFGGSPDLMLLHTTPGYEEKILKGIASVIGTDTPVYGGSAAGDDTTGNWSVFANETVCGEGFVLAGIRSGVPVQRAFIGGYLPTAYSGVVTKVDGRAVQEIDGRPAAVVYNEWTRGLVLHELDHGGNVFLKTNTLPLARTVEDTCGTQQRLLAQPYEVTRGTKSLLVLSEISQGERVTLMTATPESLVARVGRVVQRARGATKRQPRGGVMVYCGGCLDLVLDRAPAIAKEFLLAAGPIPFIGAATFGEQGSFLDKSESKHGNLMCSVLLF